MPRTPVTMVDVRMFRLSSDSNGFETLNDRLPDVARISSFFPLLRTSAVLDASSLAALVSSRAIQA